MWRTIWTITRKETIDNIRDRRSVFNALLSVLMNPLLYIVLFGFMNRAFSEQAEQALQLPVVGAEHAPNLVAFLDQYNVDILPPPADPAAAVLAGDVDVVLVIPESFGAAFTAGEPAPVQLLRDESNQGSSIPAQRAQRLLAQYGSQTAALRLLARGISPELIRPLPVVTVDVSPNETGEAGTVLNLLPVIMLTAAFLGGFYMVVDMTAGERERESLEPLLINPVPRWAFVLGKYLTALGFTILATALATALFLVLLGIPAVQEFTAIQVSIPWPAIWTAVLIIFPVVVMAVALQMLISSYTRNVKEAQTYTQLLSLAGFMPALFLAILPIKVQAWMYFVPTIGQVFLINKVMRGEALPPGDLLVGTAVTLLVGLAALAAAMRLYNRERIALIG
ncbi:MAG: ABC transporter permease [Anaerolineales bacterium]|nr:ABC transporter permease [Anaerolineales bacterium]